MRKSLEILTVLKQTNKQTNTQRNKYVTSLRKLRDFRLVYMSVFLLDLLCLIYIVYCFGVEPIIRAVNLYFSYAFRYDSEVSKLPSKLSHLTL